MAVSPSASRFYGVVLAAGESRRFGSAKALAEWQDGSLLMHAVTIARQVFEHRFLVIAGAHAQVMLPALVNTHAAFAINTRWQEGPGSSIALAIRRMPRHCAGILIWHVDQPALDRTVFDRLLAAACNSAGAPVCSRYQDTVGVPAVIPAPMFDAVVRMPPEAGAKNLLLDRSDLVTVDVGEKARDVDTPAALAQLRRDHIA